MLHYKIIYFVFVFENTMGMPKLKKEALTTYIFQDAKLLYFRLTLNNSILHAATITAGLDLPSHVPLLFYPAFFPSLQGFQILRYAAKPHSNWRLCAWIQFIYLTNLQLIKYLQSYQPLDCSGDVLP